MKINYLYEHSGDFRPHGSSVIRVIKPIGNLRDHGIEISLINCLSGIHLCDALIVDRWWRPEASPLDADFIIATCADHGIPLIYSVDDNLFDFENEHKSVQMSSQCGFARTLLKRANAIVVSTPILWERVKKMSPNVFLIPNAIDASMINNLDALVQSRQERLYKTHVNQMEIGYMGTLTHLRDLAAIAPALTRLQREFANKVRINIIGVSISADIRAILGEINYRLIDCSDCHGYDDFIGHYAIASQDWSLAIAPLIDSPVNRAKSDLKFLDYSVLGIPGIYADLPCYSNTISHGITGFLSSSSSWREWHETLAFALRSPSLLSEISQMSYNYVRSYRSVEAISGAWERVIARSVENLKNALDF